MRLNLCYLLFSLIPVLVHGAPWTRKHSDSDSNAEQLQKLAELKEKLVTLEESLKGLSENIDTYVSTNKESGKSGKHGHKRFILESPQEAAPDEDEALKDYVNSLSPSEQLMLQHMKTKVHFLQSVLHEPPHETNPGEEITEAKRSELLLPNVPQEQEDQELQTFENNLSPDDLKLLTKLKSRVKFLQGTLHEEPHGANPGEEGQIPELDVKRSELPSPDVPPEDQDNELHDFENQLSDEDKHLLQKLHSRVKFLQGALHEEPHGANPGEDLVRVLDVKRSELPSPDVPPEDQDNELHDFENQLSDQDKHLLQKLKSRVKFLQGALHEEPHGANPGEDQIKVLETKRNELPSPEVLPEDQDNLLQDFENQLSDDEKHLLQKSKGRVKYLQGILHEEPHGANPGEQGATPVLDVRRSALPVRRSALPSPNVPSESDDTELQNFMSQLSPEEEKLLKKMKNKLQFLQGVLHSDQHGPNPGEATYVPDSGTPDKRSYLPDIPEPPAGGQDQELQDLMAGLSAEDIAMLKKYQNKMKLLQGAVHAPSDQHNPGEDQAESELEQQKRGNPQATKHKPAVKKQPSPSSNVNQPTNQQPAVQRPANQNTVAQQPLVQQPINTVVQEPTNQQPANQQQYVQNQPLQQQPNLNPAPIPGTDEVIFTAADRILLKNVAAKLEELRVSLEAFQQVRQALNPTQTLQQLSRPAPAQAPVGVVPQVPVRVAANNPVQPSAAKPAPTSPKQVTSKQGKAANEVNKSGTTRILQKGTFGSFLKREQIENSSHWFERPFGENEIGLDKKCLGHDCLVRRSCVDGQCDCTGRDCRNAERELADRIISDVNEAAARKLDLRGILHALDKEHGTTRNTRQLVDREERELESLKLH